MGIKNGKDIYVFLPSWLIEAIDEYAGLHDHPTRSSAIRELLEKGLKEKKDNKELEERLAKLETAFENINYRKEEKIVFVEESIVLGKTMKHINELTKVLNRHESFKFEMDRLEKFKHENPEIEIKIPSIESLAPIPEVLKTFKEEYPGSYYDIFTGYGDQEILMEKIIENIIKKKTAPEPDEHPDNQ